MKQLGLFAGIGGFELAARWMGWDTVAWCEIDPFCQQVLSYHFPRAHKLSDIKTTDFTPYRNAIDIVTGGFPCQPYSTAGKRKGKDDDRHLWPEMLRAIREIQPRWVLGENVRGLTNWNGGVVFDEVQADLETQGYEVLPFLLPAASVNAPHRRDRIWFIAHAFSDGYGEETGPGCHNSAEGQSQSEEDKRQWIWNDLNRNEAAGITTDTPGLRQSRPGRPEHPSGKTPDREWQASWTLHDDRWPIESPICSGNDGLSGKLDGITFLDWATFSHKGYGNAVVPELVLQIYKAIELFCTNP